MTQKKKEREQKRTKVDPANEIKYQGNKFLGLLSPSPGLLGYCHTLSYYIPPLSCRLPAFSAGVFQTAPSMT